MSPVARTVCCSLLLLTVLSHSSDALYERFGCKFENRSFFVPSKNIFDVVFGQTSKIRPLNFRNFHKNELLNNALKLIEKIIGQSMQNTVYNDVDNLLDFYKLYRSAESVNKSIETIFNHYMPTYRRGSPLYFLVDIFDRLIEEKESDFDAHSYIITADDSFYGDGKDLPYHRLLPESIQLSFNHKHIAGVVKIRFGKSLAYIIIDPYHALNHVALIHRAGDAFPSEVQLSSGNLLYYQLLNTRYVVASNEFDKWKIIYHVASPFCSMISCTTKSNILALKGTIKKTDDYGIILSKISFDFLKNGTEPQLEFTYNKDYTEFNWPITVTLRRGCSVAESADIEHYTHVYEAVRDNLIGQITDFDEKMETITQIAFDDQFLDDVRGFYCIQEKKRVEFDAAYRVFIPIRR